MMIGHDATGAALEAVLKSGNIPHAFLLHGPKGIGKRVIAEQLAKRLLCGPGEGDAPLSYNAQHPIYPQIEAGSSPDYLILTPAEGKKNIVVDDVRVVLTKLSLASDGARAVIVDSADEMNASAANALLKTLEEPGEKVHLILVCHTLSKLLPTIISRCRQFRVAPLGDSDSRQVLSEHLNAEEIDVVLPLCPGQPGEALQLHQTAPAALSELTAFMSGKYRSALAISQLSDSLQQKKQAAIAVDLLLSHLNNYAKKAPDTALKLTEMYQKIQKRRTEMEIYNISPQVVLEASLLDVVPLITAT